MNTAIRLAKSDDAEIVSILGRITFSETFGNLFDEFKDELFDYLNTTFSVEKIRKSLNKSSNKYWIVIVDGLPVGYAKLKYPSDTELLPGADVAQLQKIYVLRDHLAMGLGFPLLKAVREHAVHVGARSMWLAVLSENVRAIRFYKKHHFDTFGRDTFTIGSQTFEFDLLGASVG